MTPQTIDYKDLALAAVEIAQRAGAAIMEVYQSAPKVQYKADNSPVTDADQASEAIIIEALSMLMPLVPVIAEERTAAGHIPETGELFFLVDPLDGTKEFLKRNGEFAINIALIEGNEAIFGLIFAPAKADCYVTLTRGNAFRCALEPRQTPRLRQDLDLVPLRGQASPARPFTAIVSRSYPRPEAVSYLEKIGNPEKTSLGSSLKFGVLARGEADVYPRFGPTSEWDTAAGQAILEAAGGCVLTTQGEPLRYGKRNNGFINPAFIARRRRPSVASPG